MTMGHLFPVYLKDIMQATISIVLNTSWYSGKFCNVYVTSSHHLLLTIKTTNFSNTLVHPLKYHIQFPSHVDLLNISPFL